MSIEICDKAGGIYVNNFPIEGSLKSFMIFKSLAYMARYNVHSNMIGQVWTIKNFCCTVRTHFDMPMCPLRIEERESSRKILIGTVYRNSSSSTNNNYLSFQIFPPKILRTSSQEHACPTQTYACLAKHYSK